MRFCALCRNSRWLPKVSEKNFFFKTSPVDSAYTLWVKNFVEIAPSCTVSKISVFIFHAEIQDGCKMWQESDFCEKSPIHSGHHGRRKFCVFHFWLKFENSKWLPDLGRGNFLNIEKSSLLRYPVGRKFQRNHSIPQG